MHLQHSDLQVLEQGLLVLPKFNPGNVKFGLGEFLSFSPRIAYCFCQTKKLNLGFCHGTL